MAAYLFSALCLATIAMPYVSGLECFDCVDVKVHGTAPGTEIKLQTNPACEAASITSIGGLQSHTCRPGNLCAAVKGTMTLKDDDGGYLSYSMVARSCLPAAAVGCEEEEGRGRAFVRQVMGVVDVQFKGDMCFCDQDYCSPIQCPGGYIRMVGHCMDWWMLPALVALLGISICVITCCCCCCCCCCRRTKTTGVVVSTVSKPSTQFENKLYEAMQPPQPMMGVDLRVNTLSSDVKPVKA